MKGMALASPFAPERIDLCFLDTDSSVAHVFSAGSGWDATTPEAGWDHLGGNFVTAPAIVATKAVRPLVNAPTDLTAAQLQPGPAVGQGSAGTVSSASPTGDIPGGPAAAEPPGVASAGLHGGGAGGITVFDPQPRLDVFAVGPDFAMRQQTLWQGVAPPTREWTNLGGSFISAPTAAAAFGDKRIDLFGVGQDRAMWHRIWDGEVWTGDWERLGGIFSSDASAVSWAAGRLDLFVRGADFTLRHRAYDGSQWLTDWQNLGASLSSAPVAVTFAADRLDVFAVLQDGSLGHRWWDGMIWNDWENLGFPALNKSYVGTPSAVSSGPDRIDVLTVGEDDQLYHVWLQEGSWSGPKPVPTGGDVGATVKDYAAISTMSGSFHALKASADGPILESSFDTAGWSPWQQTGMHLTLPTQYHFTIDMVVADEPRSINTDTAILQATLKVGNWKAATQHAGNDALGGTHGSQWGPNLVQFGPVTVELCDSVAFNYTIMNTSDPDPDRIDKAVDALGHRLANLATDAVSKGLAAGFNAITGVELSAVLTVPVLGPLLALAEAWFLDELKSLLFAKCDGPVAAEAPVFLGRDLHQRIAGGAGTVTTTHPGTTSADGCGPNSVYEVTWSVG